MSKGGLGSYFNADNAGLDSVGGVAGNVLTGGLYGAANTATQGQVGKQLASYDPTNPAKSNAAYGQAGQSIENQNTANQGALDKLGKSGDDYIGGLTSATNEYTGALKNLGGEVSTKQQQMSNASRSNAKGAETLQQLQDPNSNPWSQNVQKAYNQQAQGIQNQGLADYGVLAGLGAQATAGQIGGAGQPITGGQLAVLSNNNNAGASNAYSQAQGAANNLRGQGLQAGINQANTAYGFGQQAQQQAGQDLQNYYGTAANNDKDIFGANAGLASAVYGTQVGQTNAQLGQNDLYYGAQQGLDVGQAQADAAQRASNMSAITGIAGQVAGQGSKAAFTPGKGGGEGAGGGVAGVAEDAAALQDEPGAQGNYGYGPTSGSYAPQAQSSPYGRGPQIAQGSYQPGASLASNPYQQRGYS